MPVLSESNHHAPSSPCSSKMNIRIPHILAAFALLSCILVFFYRRRQRNHKASSQQITPLFNNEKNQYEYKPLHRSTTPTLDQTNLTNVRNLESVPPSPISLASSSSSSSPSLSTSSRDSFESPQRNLQIDIPRRRSYTKTIEGEVEVTGEIVVSPEGWRRHTRVFGGGVCKACEESERRMSA